MINNLALEELSLVGLTYRCQRETERFWQRLPYQPDYCFELFRRALSDPHDETAKQAWSFIHQQYLRQVTIWVKRHPHFQQSAMEPEMLAELALEKMWVSFALAPEKLSSFPLHDSDKCLRTLLRYLQTCVHSVIIDALTPVDHNLDENASALTESEPDPVEAMEFWECIYRRLRGDKERLVMDAAFVNGLKSRQIYEIYADAFTNVTEIYRIKENILARLRRDTSLRDCFGDLE